MYSCGIKHSMGSIDCLTVSGAEAKILKRLGSGFLISEGADFVTAAHVVSEMEKGDDPCPAPVITMGVGNWRPEAPAGHVVVPFQNRGLQD